jgi:tetratricopeptide (TPR) repeat protein
LLGDGEHGLASELLGRAVGLADDPRTARYNLGVAYFLQADYVAAAATFRAILEVDPTDQDARHNYELALSLIETPLPEDQQQLTDPQQGETDPTVTPTPQPGGFDGPTPTPPRAEFEPDPTQTPVGGTGDFAMANQTATPAPREDGSLTVLEAMRLLDGQNTRSIAPFDPLLGTAEGVNTENDW